MKTIPLTNSQQVALVDDEDFERVSGYSWHLGGNPRSAYLSVRTKPRNRTIVLSRLVMNAEERYEDVHHLDRDVLNNRKANLRIVRHGTHTVISKLEAGPVRGRRYKGAYFRKEKAVRPWQTLIRIEGKLVSLGYFSSEEEAAQAYDTAVEQVYGGIPGLKPYKNFPAE